MKWIKNISPGLLAFATSTVGRADFCPPPPTSIRPVMLSSVRFDKKANLYYYQYAMKNESNARIPLDWFGVLLQERPTVVRSAKHWSTSYTAASYMPHRLSWRANELKESDANSTKNDGRIPLPINAIKPGSSQDGFEISSAFPPGLVQFFAQGATQIPSSPPSEKDDEPVPDCPGWNFDVPQIQAQVTGMAIGPVNPSEIISVRLRSRDETGRNHPKPIDPIKPEGKMSVLAISTPSFNAADVDTTSLVFGPAFAKPLSHKLMPADIGEMRKKTSEDERTDWERAQDNMGREDHIRKIPSSQVQNLFLTFDVADLDIQCGLDQAIFLRGKMKSGQQIVGAVIAKVIGCKDRDFGKHKQTHFPFKWWNDIEGIKGKK